MSALEEYPDQVVRDNFTEFWNINPIPTFLDPEVYKTLRVISHDDVFLVVHPPTERQEPVGLLFDHYNTTYTLDINVVAATRARMISAHKEAKRILRFKRKVPHSSFRYSVLMIERSEDQTIEDAGIFDIKITCRLESDFLVVDT